MCTRFLLISSDPVLRESTRNEAGGLAMSFDILSTPQEAEKTYAAPEAVQPQVVMIDLGGSDRSAAKQWINYRFKNARAVFLLSGKNITPTTQPVAAFNADTWDGDDDIFLAWGRDFDSFKLFLERLSQFSGSYDQGTENEGFDALIGRSVRFSKTLELAMQAVENARIPVLLTGEKGTGKRLFAKAIHTECYGEPNGFIHIDCRAVCNKALEDALQKIYTSSNGVGNGTLFLEEVTALDPSRQAKILSYLGEPVDGPRILRTVETSKPRLIAATAHDLGALVAKGAFNRNFYTLLSELTIPLPSLRERPSDILLLAERFLTNRFRGGNSRPPKLSRGVQERLLSHPWPGNIRELFGVLEAAVEAAGNQREVMAGHLPDWLLPSSEQSPQNEFVSQENPISGRMAANCGSIINTSDGVVVHLPSNGIAFEDIEKAILKAALDQTSNNVVRAARLLHLGRGSLRYRLEKYGLVQPKRRRSAKRRPTTVEEVESVEVLRKAS
jgi:DNA-binding NtrC family response regulator